MVQAPFLMLDLNLKYREKRQATTIKTRKQDLINNGVKTLFIL